MLLYKKLSANHHFVNRDTLYEFQFILEINL